ncbi:MAG: nucleotidyltransferase domain-containing protein [Dysgonamonadaceae bacterium]|jgi:predicted nucleotidyltransferase|nr:nucleotidyltransferase domain-containing protein [Dysgonamonadaceae bacterium]
MNSIAQYKDGILQLCEKNKVTRKLYFFGSVLTPRFNQLTSDIDVLVEIESSLPPEERGEQLLNLWDGLETLFNRKVDLLTEHSLRNPYLRSEIEKNKKLIYDGQSKQVFI